MAETRKLAAILAADVVGYSKLAGADEERTLARLRALRSDLIDPDHRPASRPCRQANRRRRPHRVQKRRGCRGGIEVQNGMVERNAGLPPERRIEFRVGIHLGDVVEKSDGDLHLLFKVVNEAAPLRRPQERDALSSVDQSKKRRGLWCDAFNGEVAELRVFLADVEGGLGS